jgi:hypothetical protein
MPPILNVINNKTTLQPLTLAVWHNLPQDKDSGFVAYKWPNSCTSPPPFSASFAILMAPE